MKKTLVFFIGTVAEYIKIFPLIEECKMAGVPYKVIASGQNEIANTDIANATGLIIDTQLSYEKDIKKSSVGLLTWWLKTYTSASKKVKAALDGVDLKNAIMVVHGDTVSTVMGAMLGRRLGMKVAHVEAGLRSGNWLEPFPEEIDRMIVTKYADYNFCPGKEPSDNLRRIKVKGEIYNTEANTLVDALRFATAIGKNNSKSEPVDSALGGDKYSVFVLHRQENLANNKLMEDIVERALNTAKNMKVVFIMHEITRIAFQKQGLYTKLESNPNIVLFPRMSYFEFMKVLKDAEFVITDGGSNQEELSYMGKPALIIRKHTERGEGLGENSKLYDGNIEQVDDFIANYTSYRRPSITTEVSPSEIIVSTLMK